MEIIIVLNRALTRSEPQRDSQIISIFFSKFEPGDSFKKNSYRTNIHMYMLREGVKTC